MNGQVHEATDGRERHYFRKMLRPAQDGGWYICDCGARADRFGRVLRES